VASFLEILRDNCRDPRGDIAAAYVSLLLEDAPDAIAGEPRDKDDEQDGGAAAGDQKALPQLLRLDGHSGGCVLRYCSN